MGLLDKFKRKQNDSALPSEVDAYYKSEKRNRRSTSVIFALFALLVTLVVAAGLFFGGRAIYRALTDDNKTQVPVDSSVDNNQNKPEEQPSPSQDQNTTPTQTPAESEPQPQTQPSTNNTPPANPGSVPSTGDDTLPHTGD